MKSSGTIARKPNTGIPKFEADPINSTFRWELYLTAGRKGNSVPLMDGYSKGMGFENTNRLELLYKKLINPVLPYLTRCDLIVIYENDRRILKQLQPKILELYPHDFVAHGWVKETAVITDFLSTYYNEYVHTGIMPPIEDRRKNVRQTVYFAELDHSKQNFETLEQLRAFCESKFSKYSAQCMTGWFYRHADFQPELFEADKSEALAHTIHTASTLEAAQAAQVGLNSLYGKHASKR
ncbi:hypothetical protein G8759_19895 [Spirosoma aureum]|uniref:Uncharacterized protein n=1 Tax=Spirosoma aureum TaxID=2692134 RepID=A0A6G9AQV0_9BACT|nr:hypothetical protein [Spirosoma aureum]QIP14714.1 hypothetical protein G8759_19895 [Spirosoma aureum]